MIRKIVNTIQVYLQDFIYLLYPQICIACKIDTIRENDFLCLSCALDLPFTDQFKYDQNEFIEKLGSRIDIKQGAALLYMYPESKVQQMLHSLKYQNRGDIGVALGSMIGKEMQKHNWGQSIECIVPIPIHPKKRDFRGYNQAAQIAKGVSEIIKKPINSSVLVKKIDNSSQTKMSRRQRQQNVAQSFGLRKNASLKNMNILLVDDVITTGATLETCANLCIQLEAKTVSIVTVAYAM